MKINKETIKSIIKETLGKINTSSNAGVIQEATLNTFLEKANDEKLAFFVVSANRGERGTKYSRKNMSAGDELEAFLKSNNLSWTKVDGGYQEKVKKIDPETKEPILDDKGNDVYEIDPKTKKPKIFFSEEVSYLVFGNQPHRGDLQNAITDTMELFEIAKASCLIDETNPQDSFSFGYPTTDSTTNEEYMFIALYRPDAERPGPKHMFTDWGGPWYSVGAFGKAEGAYTTVRGGKSAFVESKLRAAQSIVVTSINEGMQKQAEIQYWTKMKTRLERHEEHPAPNSMMEAMKVSYRAKARGKKVKFIRGK